MIYCKNNLNKLIRRCQLSQMTCPVIQTGFYSNEHNSYCFVGILEYISPLRGYKNTVANFFLFTIFDRWPTVQVRTCKKFVKYYATLIK